MKTKIITLSVLMILIMIGMMLLPAAMSAPVDDFTVTVDSTQNTALLSTNTTFGSVSAGTTNDIADSFNLTNTGNLDATVTATFTTLRDTTYGLNGTTDVIGGANFSMALVGQPLEPLDNIAAGTLITSSNNVAADAVTDIWKVQLIVPAGQTAETYTGTVQLTFSN